MGDPLSIASGVLALSVFAFKSSVSLYQSVKGFQNNRKAIRELEQELEALKNVLQSLQQFASKNEDQFKTLCLPLLRCGQACKDFEEVIANCTKHSSDSKTSFRDWAKLQYLGSDIVEFKNMLAGHKATISVAIGDINLRTAAVSASAVQEFKDMLKDTKTDLGDHLENLDDKLEALSTQESRANEENIAGRRRIQEEIDCAKACLAVCAQASEHADKVRTNVFEDVTAAQDSDQIVVSTLGDLISAKRITAGVRATQWIGQMSDTSLQQLARGRGIDLSSGSRIVRDVADQDRGSIIFEDQYGSGHKLG